MRGMNPSSDFFPFCHCMDAASCILSEYGEISVQDGYESSHENLVTLLCHLPGVGYPGVVK